MTCRPVAAPDFFFFFFFVGRGIKWAKCISEGATFHKFAQNGWFWPFFSSDWGQVGVEPPTGGGQMPPCPPWCRHCCCLHLSLIYFCKETTAQCWFLWRLCNTETYLVIGLWCNTYCITRNVFKFKILHFGENLFLVTWICTNFIRGIQAEFWWENDFVHENFNNQ